MAQTEKFQPRIITFKDARAAFLRVHKAEARIDRKTGKPKGDPKFSGQVLFDPSRTDHAAVIREIKEESVRALNHRYGEGRFTVQMLEEFEAGKRVLSNFYLPWGYGNHLPIHGKKIYDGFADMFYLKLADKNRPNLLNRAGKPVVEGDPQCPYSGCYVAGTTTLYTYDNESRGVGANLRTLVFMRDGAAFGGGAVNAEQEFAAIGDLGNEPPAGDLAGGADPFTI